MLNARQSSWRIIWIGCQSVECGKLGKLGTVTMFFLSKEGVHLPSIPRLAREELTDGVSLPYAYLLSAFIPA